MKTFELFTLVLVVFALAFSACSPKTQNSTSQLEQDGNKLVVTVSILPQKWFVDRIGGDLIDTQALVGTGDDPHSYEPSPVQMASLAKSSLFFTVGIEFEEAWMDKLSSANKDMYIVDSAAGIERIAMIGGHHRHDAHDEHDDDYQHEHDDDYQHEHDHDHDDDEHEHDEHDHEALDPHVWFSAANAKIIANNIANALIELDPANETVYENNLSELIQEIEKTDDAVRTLLKDLTRDHFMIMHPAWGYFAHDYQLHIIPVEIGGGEPAPEDLAKILDATQEYKITVIFVEKGTNMNLARSLARQAGIDQIIEWDPMAYEWAENMLALARDLSEALR